MSDDLFAFDVEAAPKRHAEFMTWYEAQTEAEDSSADPATLSPTLRDWFSSMIQTFPALNGPAAPADIEDRCDDAADYSMQPHSISVNFGWSQASRAAEEALRTAKLCGVGNFDPQGGDIAYLPSGSTPSPQGKSLLHRLFRR